MLLVAKGDVGRRVLDVMGRRRLTAKDLVAFSLRKGRPVTYQRITNWKNGENDPKPDLLPLLAEFSGVTVEELLGSKPLAIKERPRLPVRAEAQGEIEVPRIHPVAAGAEWTDPFDSDETEPVPAFMVTEMSFVAPVDGDSMNPLLHEQDLAVFEARQARIGMIVVARNGQGGLTIKQLKHNGRDYILHPLNPKFSDLEAASWRVEGYLTGIIRDVQGERLIRNAAHGIYPNKENDLFS